MELLFLALAIGGTGYYLYRRIAADLKSGGCSSCPMASECGKASCPFSQAIETIEKERSAKPAGDGSQALSKPLGPE